MKLFVAAFQPLATMKSQKFRSLDTIPRYPNHWTLPCRWSWSPQDRFFGSPQSAQGGAGLPMQRNCFCFTLALVLRIWIINFGGLVGHQRCMIFWFILIDFRNRIRQFILFRTPLTVGWPVCFSHTTWETTAKKETTTTCNTPTSASWCDTGI